MKKDLTNILIVITIALLLFVSGYKLGEHNQAHAKGALSSLTGGIVPKEILGTEDKKDDIDFDLFWKTWDMLEEKYVSKEDLDAKQMYYGAIKGMVASAGDPYTFFMTPKEHEDSQKDLEGKFEGIGAQLGLKDNQIMIIAPLKDSPAEKAGVKRGDIITEVDGQSTQGWTLRDAVNDIRGEGGTEVILTVYRNGDEIEIPITRDEIKVSSVELSYESYEDSGQIAYLKLNQFGESTNAEWNEAVKQIKSKWEGGEIKGMVLDVRDNPGGYLDSSVYIASEFVEKGKLIVKQESLQDDIEYKSRRRGRLLDIPLVVLINQGSASASEILSGALRDHDRAKLVGMKSFGKGSVQEDVNLDKNAGLRVTVAKWVLPGGDWIHEKGIEPDLEVENEFDGENTITKETDKQLKKALEEVSK